MSAHSCEFDFDTPVVAYQAVNSPTAKILMSQTATGVEPGDCQPLTNRLISSARTHVVFCVSKIVSVSYGSTQVNLEPFSGVDRMRDTINNVYRFFGALHIMTVHLDVDRMDIISNVGSNYVNRSMNARVACTVSRGV